MVLGAQWFLCLMPMMSQRRNDVCFPACQKHNNSWKFSKKRHLLCGTFWNEACQVRKNAPVVAVAGILGERFEAMA
jgi:hypothetical protein